MYFLTWLARFLSEEFGLETRTPLKMYDTRRMPLDSFPKSCPDPPNRDNSTITQ